MEELRKKARELLESGTVKMVIGFGEGSAKKAKPVFISNVDDCNKLIYDERCVHNLAVYLNKHEIKHMGKVAIVATYKVMKSVLLLAAEHQQTDGGVILLGIGVDGKYVDLPNFEAVENYIAGVNIVLTDEERALLQKIESMSVNERWDFWQEQFSKCIKCYACRAACTFCYCTKCTVESNQPQWISVGAHPLGNLEWHIMRAMHLVGRCVNCGECARACSLDIPLNLLQYKLTDEIYTQFGTVAGHKHNEVYSLSTFKSNDKENFII